MLKMTFKILLLLWMCCELCIAIKVPVVWNSDSDVNNNNDDDFSVHQFQPQHVNSNNGPASNPIPTEYFHYSAKKPQYAVDVAKFHGVQAPENHYSAYPIRPYIEVQKPDLGKHHINDKRNKLYEQLQNYKKQEYSQSEVTPHDSSYEVFHPYEREVKALQSIYKDPVLDKIRHDVKHTKNRLQNYEKKASESDISKNEYLENLEITDKKKFPHPNIPSEFEKHKPMRRPIYYIPKHFNTNYNMKLNKNFRHPLNQNFVKIKPIHYRPLRGHLYSLRKHHAHKYDDEKNEYPQVVPVQNFAEPPEGYDIYEKGEANFKKLRDHVDESVNRAVTDNHPVQYERLELKNNKSDEDDDSEEIFVPVKSFAQVRKTETARHLPRTEALHDATNYEELYNAPRLTKAVKSTKAQTVYSEEGYEDSAYDHAGEQKHASDHEGHGGYLVEKELSGGKYKIPSISAANEDESSSTNGDKILHGEKWENNNKDHEKETKNEDYSNDDHEKIIYADDYKDFDLDINDKDNATSSEHDVSKREASFKVPELNLNDTFFTEEQILLLSKEKKTSPVDLNIKEKYPYYFKKFHKINKNSPLKYAENLKLIPKKSKGGTEFYDSRSKILECPEIDDHIDPIPEKLKSKDTTQTSNTADSNESQEKTVLANRKKRQADFDEMKNVPRLKGLGDKIDCFKAKYFGLNPLDSPFFKEELVSNPEPIIIPNLPFSNKNYDKKQFHIKNKQNKSIFEINPQAPHNQSKTLYTNFKEIVPKRNVSLFDDNIFATLLGYKAQNISNDTNILYNPLLNKEDTTQSLILIRRRRSFTYEPYKKINDSQIASSKVSSVVNMNPFIKPLPVNKVTSEINNVKKQPVKRNAPPRLYKHINRSNKSKYNDNKNITETKTDFVDVSIDPRRGEPRYEIKSHKLSYSPIKNKKNTTVEDYQPASNINMKKVVTTTPAFHNKNRKLMQEIQKEEFKKNDDDILRLKKKERAIDENMKNLSPKLVMEEKFHLKPLEQDVDNNKTKYIEKYSKSSKRTVVSDFNSNDDGDDDMKKDDVDAMMGIKQNMDEYTPNYEKEYKNENTREYKSSEENSESLENQSDENNSYELGDISSEDFSEENVSSQSNEDSNEKKYKSSKTEQNDEKENKVVTIVTPFFKNYLIDTTTVVPPPNNEVRSYIKMRRPLVLRKNIKIHTEQPYNKYSPHITQFREDNQEMIVKNYPRVKPSDYVQILDAVNRKGIAKEVNELGDVEVFKKNLDTMAGPKHGGNYKSANILEENGKDIESSNHDINRDVKTLENKDTHEISYMIPPNANIPEISKKYKNKDLTEFQDTRDQIMHGGNLMKYDDFKNEELKHTDNDDQIPSKSNGLSPKYEKNEEFTEIPNSKIEILMSQPIHGDKLRKNKDSNKRYDDQHKYIKNKELTEMLYAENQHKTNEPTHHVKYKSFKDSVAQNDDRNEELVGTYDTIIPQANEPNLRKNTNIQLSNLHKSKIEPNSDQPMHGGNYMAYEDSLVQNNNKDNKLIVSQSEKIDNENNDDDGGKTFTTIVKDKASNHKSYNDYDLKGLRAKSESSRDSKTSAAKLYNFLQVVPMLTTTPTYILDPSKRRYYLVDP